MAAIPIFPRLGFHRLPLPRLCQSVKVPSRRCLTEKLLPTTREMHSTTSSPVTTEKSNGTVLSKDRIPINCVQATLLAAGSALGALHDPERADLIAVLGETTGGPALRRMREKMLSSATGQDILKRRQQDGRSPLVPDAGNLRSLPSDTFGSTYIQWMDSHGYLAEERPPVRFVEDEQLIYVMERYRLAHDFVHVLLNVETSVMGEIAVKWFEMLQTGLPMTLLSSLFGPIRLTASENVELVTRYIPWAVRTSQRAEFFLNIPFESHWADNVEDVRRRYGLIPFRKA